MATPHWFFFALIPLILWRIYARVRRQVGRQRSRAGRHWLAVTLFALLVLLFTLGALRSPVAEAALWGGVAGGVVLGVVALRLTRFERTGDGFFYTPNAYIGVGLSMLLAGRILYRMTQLYGVGGPGTMPAAATNADFARSPFTLLVFGLVAGYYVAYAAGLLRWRGKAKARADL